MKSGRFIGVMSGTSLDGVDVVLATIDEHRSHSWQKFELARSVSLKQAVLDICRGQQLTLSQFGQLDTQRATFFADAVNALLKEQNLQARDSCDRLPRSKPSGTNRRAWHHLHFRLAITVIKLWRAPELRLSVISPSRYALGGQGARWYLRSIMRCWLATERRMVLNIGGIANLSLLIQASRLGLRYRSGNMLMDAGSGVRPVNLTIKMPSGHGRVKLFSLLQNMLCDPYFSQPAPKAPDANTLTTAGWNAICAIFRGIPVMCSHTGGTHRRDHF